VAKIGSVAYKLNLPANSSIHLVFHVSQLKKVVSPSTEIATHLSDLVVALYRLIKRADTEVAQVLIKWSGMSRALAALEDKETLLQQFPVAPTWGQAAGGGGGVSTPARSSGTKSRAHRKGKCSTNWAGVG
jgi:hypothetical protein